MKKVKIIICPVSKKHLSKLLEGMEGARVQVFEDEKVATFVFSGMDLQGCVATMFECNLNEDTFEHIKEKMEKNND